MAEPDLTGTWHGHYVQGGAEHAVTMTLVQKGRSLVGSMRDAETLWMSSDTLVRDGAERVQVSVDVLTELPAESVVEGEVDGARVTFVKRYCGPHTFTLWLGTSSASARLDDHRVLYLGELDEDGRVLRGEWTIPPRADELESADEDDGESGDDAEEDSEAEGDEVFDPEDVPDVGEGGTFVLRRA